MLLELLSGIASARKLRGGIWLRLNNSPFGGPAPTLLTLTAVDAAPGLCADGRIPEGGRRAQGVCAATYRFCKALANKTAYKTVFAIPVIPGVILLESWVVQCPALHFSAPRLPAPHFYLSAPCHTQPLPLLRPACALPPHPLVLPTPRRAPTPASRLRLRSPLRLQFFLENSAQADAPSLLVRPYCARRYGLWLRDRVPGGEAAGQRGRHHHQMKGGMS